MEQYREYDSQSRRPASAAGPQCHRCGLCCLKGGATLMREDAPLLRASAAGAERPQAALRSAVPSGPAPALPLTALVCLRRGEWARDEVQGGLRPLEQELLKLAPASLMEMSPRPAGEGRGSASAEHPWACRYYAPRQGCTVYAQRPVQCRVLLCEDTAPLEKLLATRDFLDRKAALAAAAAQLPQAAVHWGQLIDAHEESCPAGPVLAVAARLGFAPAGGRGRDAAAAGATALDRAERQRLWEEIQEKVRFDAAFRQLCVERAAVPEELLPFLLGRPLLALLAEVGLCPC